MIYRILTPKFRKSDGFLAWFMGKISSYGPEVFFFIFGKYYARVIKSTSGGGGGMKRLRVSIPIVKVNIQGSYHTICDSLVWGSDKPLRDRMARLTSAPFGNDNCRGMGCLIRSLIY